MALAKPQTVAGMAVSKIGIYSGVLVFVGAILLAVLSWGLINGFTALAVSKLLIILAFILLLSLATGYLASRILISRSRRLAEQLQIINDTLPLLLARRYEKVDEHLQTTLKR